MKHNADEAVRRFQNIMNLVEEIHCENGLVVEAWDNSRSIADDTTQVRLVIKTKVDIKKEYFSTPEQYDQVLKVFGPVIYFEYQKDRTFVSNKDKEDVFTELLEYFRRNSLPYIARPQFPARFAMSKYAEIQKRFYKYRHLLQ